VESVEASQLAKIEEPVALRFRLAVPAYAQREGDGLRFSPFGAQRSYSERWAGLAARRQDLVLGDPDENRFTYRIALPKGFDVRELPEAATADTSHASFEVRYRAEPGAVVAEGRFILKDGRIPVADYAAFRAFTAAADAAFARTVQIGPAARPPETR